MSFAGKIEDFSVTDIMQYIHTSQKSGTLKFESNSDQGWVAFKNGQIIRANRPGAANIGDLLLDGGKVSESNLKAAVRIQKVQSPPKPLGMILEEMGLITHKSIKDAVIKQIEEVIYELVTWEKGSFRFELNEIEISDDIQVAPDDLIPPEEIDTKMLLIEAMRQLEKSGNGNQPKIYPVEAVTEETGLDRAPEIPPLAEPEKRQDFSLSPEELESHAQCLALLREMLQEGRKKDKSQSILICFMKILSEYLDRAVVFLVRKSELVGFGAFGRTDDEGSLNKEVKNLRIGLDPDSLPAKCVLDGGPYLDRPPQEPWLEKLYQRIGAPRKPEVLLMPVSGVAQVICMVYADYGNREIRPANLELLEIAAGQTGIIFENTVLRRQADRKNP